MKLSPPHFSETKKITVDLRHAEKKEIVEYLLQIKADLPQFVALYLKDVSPTQRKP
jgi:hypothetical protein